MTSGFQTDLNQIAQTSQQAANAADAILGYFHKMDADTATVLQVCKGDMFTALTTALADLQQERNKLIPRLAVLSGQLKQGGHGMAGQDSGAANGIRGLSTPLNH